MNKITYFFIYFVSCSLSLILSIKLLESRVGKGYIDNSYALLDGWEIGLSSGLIMTILPSCIIWFINTIRHSNYDKQWPLTSRGSRGGNRTRHTIEGQKPISTYNEVVHHLQLIRHKECFKYVDDCIREHVLGCGSDSCTEHDHREQFEQYICDDCMINPCQCNTSDVQPDVSNTGQTLSQ